MRLFVAVNFPTRVRRDLVRAVRELTSAEMPVRWVAGENLHLTLRFLGERPADDRRRAAKALVQAVSGMEPVDVRFGRLGAFPTPRRPRVIWIGVEATPRLRLLRDAVDRSLAAAGFGSDDRSFRPHVTIGRAAAAAGPGAFDPLLRLGPTVQVDSDLEVRRVDLVRSRTGPEGATYDILDRVSF